MMKSIAIDEEGYFKTADGLRMDDAALGREWLSQLRWPDLEMCHFEHNGETILVECYDKPYVAQQIHLENKDLVLQMPYDFRVAVKPESLCLDPADRFHGLSLNGVPFVLTNKAQAELFNLADQFTDTSVTVAGQTIETHPYYDTSRPIQAASFWDGIYQENIKPGWDLAGPHPALETILPQLKLLQGRVLVGGCGKGHDAHMLARAGHHVTGVDFSTDALTAAKNLYQAPNLKWLEADIFSLKDSHPKRFDYIFEHTCFCAVSPEKREALVKTWFHTLDEGGHLLGLFLIHPRRQGPPFGTSEWELQKLLSPYFDFRYWTRAKISPGWRQGLELIVYAEKKKGRR